MVPLGFQLGDDDDRQDYLVLIEAHDSHRDGPGAKTGHRRVGWTGPGPQKGRAGPSVSSPTRNARSTKIRGPSRERRRAVHHYRRYPPSRVSKSTARLLAGVSPGNRAYVPKRRFRAAYERSARRKSTLRKAGQ